MPIAALPSSALLSALLVAVLAAVFWDVGLWAWMRYRARAIANRPPKLEDTRYHSPPAFPAYAPAEPVPLPRFEKNLKKLASLVDDLHK